MSVGLVLAIWMLGFAILGLVAHWTLVFMLFVTISLLAMFLFMVPVVARRRKKIESDSNGPCHIGTESGTGHRFIGNLSPFYEN